MPRDILPLYDALFSFAASLDAASCHAHATLLPLDCSMPPRCRVVAAYARRLYAAASPLLPPLA